jgi:non-specific serine/threonine protein kinase/serine/threonine-protein kinase
VLSPKPAVTQTLTSGWALMPYYASPEQIRGETITTASDVYSLGVVLYELLTGRRPYEFASALPPEIARVVCEKEPARPSEVVLPTLLASPRPMAAPSEGDGDRDLGARRRRELRGDLDNIVLMALRKEPSRRYASAEQLSEDLRRHLEGMPVLARKDTLAYRAGKFVRRHRVGVASTALVALSLVLGLVSTARQARLAQAQKARAERRFEDVRRLARSFLFEIHDEIQDLPGATRARATLVTRGLEYLDGLAQEAQGDFSLQAELAEAYLKVGDVQGRPGFSNLGDRAGAAESYRKSVELRESILAQRPSPDCRRELATALDRLGDTQRLLGSSAAALESYRRALALREGEKTASADRDLATNLQRIADMQGATGEGKGALESQRRALALLEQIAAGNPGEAPAVRDLFIARVKMGDRLTGTGDRRGALASYRSALATSEQMAARDPRSARARRELAVCQDKVGDALAALGETKEALVEYRAALGLREALVASDRRDAELRRDLSVSHDKIGRILLAHGDGEEALASFRRALELDQTAVGADPTSAQARLDVSSDLENVAAAHLHAGRLAEAETGLRRALELRERISREDPANTDVRGGLVSLYANLGRLEARRAAGRPADAAACARARDWHDQALRVEQEGITLPTDAQDALRQLAADLVRCPLPR